MEYIRFTTFQIDKYSKKPQGIFQTLFDLKNFGLMQDYEIEWFETVLNWFNKNLKSPTQFSRSKKTHAAEVGLCWYKSTSHEYINKMYELVEILRYHSVEVNIIKSTNPGYIVFEDDYQIVAEPFVETKGNKLKE